MFVSKKMFEKMMTEMKLEHIRCNTRMIETMHDRDNTIVDLTYNRLDSAMDRIYELDKEIAVLKRQVEALSERKG